MSGKDIASARIRAEAARERLIDTAHEVQARLRPATLADEALTKIKRRGERAVNKRPFAVAATAGGVVALLAARPIARLIGRIGGRNKGGNTSTDGDNR